MSITTNEPLDKLTPTGGTLGIDGSVALPKTSGTGLKVDVNGTPTFPWNDLLCQVEVRNVGATSPSFNVFRGGIRAYQFTVNDEWFAIVHLPHGLVPGSDVHWHIHWAVDTAPASGGVTWGVELTYAKGHQQAAFPVTKTLTISQTASTTAYTHHIAEAAISTPGGSATLLDSNLLEPDGLILIRTYLQANTIPGTPEPFVFMGDLHFQDVGIGTKNKAPNFYS